VTLPGHVDELSFDVLVPVPLGEIAGTFSVVPGTDVEPDVDELDGDVVDGDVVDDDDEPDDEVDGEPPVDPPVDGAVPEYCAFATVALKSTTALTRIFFMG